MLYSNVLSQMMLHWTDQQAAGQFRKTHQDQSHSSETYFGQDTMPTTKLEQRSMVQSMLEMALKILIYLLCFDYISC